jgi:hypothetical protein
MPPLNYDPRNQNGLCNEWENTLLNAEPLTYTFLRENVPIKSLCGVHMMNVYGVRYFTVINPALLGTPFMVTKTG